MRTGKLIGQFDNIQNLKLAVNASVNKLDIFSKDTGVAPTSANPIWIKIPDGTGNVYRKRAAAYLSGTSQFIMADAANYWSKGSLDAEIKTAYVYAIWDGTGIVWALGGYSGFTRVPASTTATDDDFFLLEAGSTYTKAVTEYCVCVGKIRYQYDTADTPDHTIQATVIDAPQVIWNPKSDYGKFNALATTVTYGTGDGETALIAAVIKQSGNYTVNYTDSLTTGSAGSGNAFLYVKMGSATYGSAVSKVVKLGCNIGSGYNNVIAGVCSLFINAGDSLHLGASMTGNGTRYIYGSDNFLATTGIGFHRID